MRCERGTFIPQVFSKLQPESDSWVWEEAPRSGRKPYLEAFWLQMVALSWDPELGAAASLPIVSAARSSVSLPAICQALAVLFCSPCSLHAAAGVFSELAWQVEDREFLSQVASHLQDVQVLLLWLCSGVTSRCLLLRLLTFAAKAERDSLNVQALLQSCS